MSEIADFLKNFHSILEDLSASIVILGGLWALIEKQKKNPRAEVDKRKSKKQKRQ